MLKNKSQIEFSAEPAWYFNVQMMSAIDAILGLKAPALAYDKYFDEHSGSERENPSELQPINNLLQELTDHINTGKHYSLEELASQARCTYGNNLTARGCV